ncbi:MAG TPA: DUF6067 family protein, partial [Candidatus Brocadiia bacterium]|nr:DUF6067 family protein [Candidatus Brocadiia bacterium]
MGAMRRLWLALALGPALWGAGALAGSLPVFRIPRMAKAPVIDGTIDMRGWPQDEWSGATHLMGFWQTDRQAASTVQQHARVGYDAQCLYVACSVDGAEAGDIRCRAAARDAGAWEDESIEVHVGVGETPAAVFQLVVNADNVIYDAVNEGRKHSKDWNGAWEHRTSRRADGWQVEMAIPWKTLGVEEPKAGQVLRMNLASNHTVAGQEGAEVSSWGPLMDAKGKARTLDDLETLPRATLSGDAVTAGATFTMEKGDTPVVRIRAFNPGAKDATVEYCVLKEFWNRLLAPAGKFSGVAVKAELDSEGLGRQPIRVKDETGEIIFRQVMPLRSRIGASIELKKYFPLDRVEVVIQSSVPKGARAEMTVKDGRGAELSRQTAELAGGRPAPLPVDIGAWPLGAAHTLNVNIADAKGEKLASRFFTLTRPPKPAWLATQAGKSDLPIPPFTAIRVQGTTLSCLLKDYGFGQRSLPASVKSEGFELLASPIRLEMTSGGKSVDLAAQPMRVTSARANRVEWASAEAEALGLRASHAGWMEEDGFAWMSVTLEAEKPVTVDGLQLAIPARREFALFYNGGLSQQPGRYDDVGRLTGAGHAFESFMGIISVLNYERGLCVVTDNLEAWRPKDLNRCQSVEVTADAATIRYRIIEKPTVFQGKQTFEFGLMAMPAKPVDRKSSQRRMVHDVRYDSAVMSAGIGGAGRAEYPAEGNIDPRQGCLEARVFTDWDATYEYPDKDWRWYLSRRLVKITDGAGYAMLFWNAHTKAWEFSRGGKGAEEVKVAAAPVAWPKPAWRHVALTWGDKLRLYADGKLAGETEAKGLLPKDMADLGKAMMIFGKENKSYRSEFRVAAIRISSAALAPEQMALDGKFTLRPDTVFLQDFAGAADGAELPAPRKGKAGRLAEGARIVNAHGEPALTFGPIPDLSRIEMLAAMGVKVVGYHSHWTEDYGAPSTPHALSLKTLTDICERHGMRLLV